MYAKFFFDISGLNINMYEGELLVDWLFGKLQNALEKQKWYMSKRVKAAANSIDEYAFELMYQIGCRPPGSNHFNIAGMPYEVTLSVLRMIDLAILWFATGIDESGREHAYRWTPFGREVIKYLGIKLLTEEEFKASDGYGDFIKAREEYRKKKGIKLNSHKQNI